MPQVYGNIHSIETMGTVDGPGVRFVVFTQGCPMRCLYCHNPDTWNMHENKKMTPDEILLKYDGVKEFTKGGITVTGGEPLHQADFVIELFKKARSKGIHTALDTSGIYFDKNNTRKFDELIKYTSLVLLDIKEIDPDKHKKLTGHSNQNILDFARYLSENSIPVWIRYVVVPNLTDDKNDLMRLGKFLSTLKNIKALDVIPYHDMAIPKYKELQIEYKIKDTKTPSKEETIEARNIILSNMKA